MKKNKLYKVTKGNANIFDIGGQTSNINAINYGTGPANISSAYNTVNANIPTTIDASKAYEYGQKTYGNSNSASSGTNALGYANAVQTGVGLATNAINTANSVADTTSYVDNILTNQRGAIGNDSFQALENDYANNVKITAPTAKELTNSSTLGDVSNVIGSTGSGAATGAQIGGLYGGIIGGIVGLGSSLTGIFTRNHKAKKKAKKLQQLADTTNEFNDRQLAQRGENLMKDQAEKAALKAFAFGGPINGPLDYTFYNDYLNIKQTQANASNKLASQMPNSFMNAGTNFFDTGGFTSTHGADFPTGLTHIDKGGSHEENPNSGIQVGRDAEGTPDLVEEGETIWNDYVFSNRINVPIALSKRMRLGGTRKHPITFADASKKLEKEIEERPNDPISRKGLESSLQKLMEAQEQIRQAEMQKRLQAQLEQMSPEQREQLLQQIAAQQQQAEQPQEQVPPEAMQEQVPPQMQEQAMQEQQVQPQMAAYGGKVRLHGLGDYLKQYFPGYSYEDLAQLVYEANAKELGDKQLWMEKYSDPTTWEDEKYFTPLLENAYYSINPMAKNSQVKFNYTPVSTYNPLEIALDAENGYSNPPNADKYRPFTEDAFVNDAAYAELTEDQKKLKGQELAKALEGTKAYKAYRDYLKGDEKAALAWMGNLASHKNPYASNRVEKDSNGNWKWKDGYNFDNFESMLNDISYDAATNPDALGMGHLTPTMITNTSDRYFIDNGDGTFSQITSPKEGYDLVNKDPYLTTVNGVNYKDYYYKAIEGTKDANGNTKDEKLWLDPIHKNDSWKYGIMGPGMGLLMQAAGVGKPNTSGYDAALKMATHNTPMMAGYETLGNKLVYQPMDRDYYANKLASQAASTAGQIMNSSTNPSRVASLLAADYNAQGKQGDLFRQAEEYNDAQKQKVAEFNRATDQFNASAANQAYLQYANAVNSQKTANASLAMQAAEAKENARANWYQGIYGNIGQLAAGINAGIKQDQQHNMIADMAAQGLFGVIDPDSPMGMRVVRRKNSNKTK